MILTIITSIFAVSAISTNATSSQAPTLRADLTYSRSTTGNRATYPDIKAYVQDKYDIKVSTLAIAQTKAKCGIIERENYNKPKSENAKQPKCPPHKEKAIREALKHFGMI